MIRCSAYVALVVFGWLVLSLPAVVAAQLYIYPARGQSPQQDGADGERGWIALINETTGGISVAVSGDGEGFVIFGQCGLQ